jgi:hypothetical protein
MGDRPGDEMPVVDYEAPARGASRQLVLGHAMGLGAAIVLVAASAFIGSAIDAKVNAGEELAGLGGLIVGGLVGFGLVLITALVGTTLGRRRGSAILRGAGQGLFIALGLAGLWLGVCALGTLA